jgi:competence protein ComEA
MKSVRNVLASLLLGYAVHAVAAPEIPVDINTADAMALAEAMDGVGPAKAEAIVDYREENGPFSSLDDLVLIKGIGAATLDRNRDRLTVGKSRP